MKPLLQFAVCLLLVSFVFGCKESAPSPAADQSTPEPPEPPKVASLEIDPLTDPIVVGKDYIQMMSDTLNVQMYLMTMKPGDSVGLHVHPDHTVYVLEGGKLMLYMDGTEAMEMELPTGVGFVSGPLTDAATNIGDTEIQLIISEIYRPRE